MPIEAELGHLADDEGATLFFATDWRQPNFHFADPDGNVLEIITSSQQGNKAGWVSVCEMGIPVPAVQAFRSVSLSR